MVTIQTEDKKQTDSQFDADLGLWQCFGGKDVMLERQKKIMEELEE